jgi:hypothetical protein
MSQRRSFRPAVVEVLEGRVVLSRLGPAGTLGAAHVAAAHALGQVHARTRSTSGGRLGNVGALGDSYTDEYRQFLSEPRGHARNWVEILSATRNARFGPYAHIPLLEPRDVGFTRDWARSDATSTDMIQNQLGGLVNQVHQGQVKTASVFVGGNDFLFAFRKIINGQTAPADAASALQQVEAQLETNYTTAVNSLLAASPKVRVVVWTLPDIANLPVAREAVAANPALVPLRDLSTQLIQLFNAKLTATVAANPRIALVDLATLTQQLATSPPLVPYGGVTIDLVTPGNDYHHFFLGDGIHVGTVAQGLIANAFVNAVNTQFGLHIHPLTSTQIVRFAQLAQSPAGFAIP